MATGRLGVRFWLADQVDWHTLYMQKHSSFQLPHGFGQSQLRYDTRFLTEHGMCPRPGCLRVIRGSRNARGLGETSLCGCGGGTSSRAAPNKASKLHAREAQAERMAKLAKSPSPFG